MGSEIYESNPRLTFTSAIERDKIKYKSAYEDLLEYTITTLLKIRNLSAKDCSLLITFPLNGSREDRDKLQKVS